MDQCRSCGATMSAEAEWCGQCYAVRAAAPTGGFPQLGGGTPWQASPPSVMSPVRAAPTKSEAPSTIKTRWRKTPTTFGPLGRMSATIGLILVELFFIVVGVLSGGMTLAGAVIWGGIIMPWALRDIWRAGTMPDPKAPPVPVPAHAHVWSTPGA